MNNPIIEGDDTSTGCPYCHRLWRINSHVKFILEQMNDMSKSSSIYKLSWSSKLSTRAMNVVLSKYLDVYTEEMVNSVDESLMKYILKGFISDGLQLSKCKNLGKKTHAEITQWLGAE